MFTSNRRKGLRSYGSNQWPLPVRKASEVPLSEIIVVVRQNREKFLESWNEYFKRKI